MTTNTILTTSLISKTALAMFANNAPFVMTASRIYQPEFSDTGYKIGSSINMKRQNNYVIGDGSAATAQNITESVETLTISHQYNAFISYSIQDLTLSIDDFSRMFLQPAIQGIISKMESDICTSAINQLNYFVGTPGTALNSFLSVDTAGAKLLLQGVDIASDTYLATTVLDGSTLKAGLQGNFTPNFNEDIVRRSSIGHLSYFDIFQSQNIQRHFAGNGPTLHPGDSLTVNGAVTSGNTIVLAGATTGVTNYFLPGDLISFSPTVVQSVNPLNLSATSQGMQFVITAPANSSGGGAVTITVSPSIISTGPYVNTAPGGVGIPSGAPVLVTPSYNCNVAYPARALDIVCPPLFKLQVPFCSVAVDPETRLSLTVTQIGDITNYVNLMRIDLLCGFLWHPQYAVKVLT